MARENVIFLLLMLGNVLFGLQELCVLLWRAGARRYLTDFNGGFPAAMEDPHVLSDRLKNVPWPKVWRELGRWVAISSMVYWPRRMDCKLALVCHADPRWLEIRYGRCSFLLRTDIPRRRTIGDLEIHVDHGGRLRITSGECQLLNYFRAEVPFAPEVAASLPKPQPASADVPG